MNVETITDDIHNIYHEYCLSCTGADRELWDKALEYEEYFDDMTFEADSILSAFIRYEVQDPTGRWTGDYDNFFMGLGANCIRFFVEKIDKKWAAGFFEKKERKVVVAPEYADNKPVILHEMIHVYEHIVGCRNSLYHDILMFCLYNDLRKKISDLDDRIVDHAHVIQGRSIAQYGGAHDILFFLKSLDLDLRCDYKLGTVCGYDRDKFKHREQPDAEGQKDGE